MWVPVALMNATFCDGIGFVHLWGCFSHSTSSTDGLMDGCILCMYLYTYVCRGLQQFPEPEPSPCPHWPDDLDYGIAVRSQGWDWLSLTCTMHLVLFEVLMVSTWEGQCSCFCDGLCGEPGRNSEWTGKKDVVCSIMAQWLLTGRGLFVLPHIASAQWPWVQLEAVMFIHLDQQRSSVFVPCNHLFLRSKLPCGRQHHLGLPLIRQ